MGRSLLKQMNCLNLKRDIKVTGYAVKLNTRK